MRSEEDFLEALRDCPDDDDLRLVFADWLEDQDDGRSAFLRLQVQRRRLPEGDPKQGELLTQQKQLIDRSLRGWLAPLREYSISIMRGSGLLVVAMSAAQLRALTPAAQETPAWLWVDGLRLYHLDPEALTETLTAPALAHFRHLDLGLPALREQDTLFRPGLAILEGLRHAPLDRLVSLDLSAIGLTHEAGRYLTELPYPRRLRGLCLAENDLGNVGVVEMLRYGSFDALRVLDLRCCGLGTLAAEALAGSTLLARLDALGLQNNELKDQGARLLAQSRDLPRLKALDLRGNEISERMAEFLRGRCPGLLI